VGPHDLPEAELIAIPERCIARLLRLVFSQEEAECGVGDACVKWLRVGPRDNPEGWFWTQALNMARNLRKKNRRRMKLLGRPVALDSISSAGMTERDVRVLDLNHAIEQLPLHLQNVVSLRRGGSTYAEIAGQLGVCETTVAAWMREAERQLRSAIGERG
jgi:DNA-directed RNA polymerase specialized sigma24 family protein